ncbi:hypothetical protein [Afipia sp. 1NLS2]|uniref:hypothetical protein n=1 Tax=Afipia sp. 1NLS2 TaxID=666684 RepID=UPI0001D9FD63|nr:hypothetical protein [Afipia sp. 1NLS2]EFI53115.1 hypothetical protein AfiDRAFT_1102 [Afipia sp. 1NLS2]
MESGHYVLIDDDRIVAHGRMQRPNDGKVADNGNFILNDWRFAAELSGTFWAFKADGSPILSQPFAANLFNNGLSADGTFAACHTCNSGSEPDSAVLAIFDLSRGKELTRFRAESGWPNTYEFLVDERTVRGQTPTASPTAFGVCPPTTMLTMRSRPYGVRRALLWMSIRLLQGQVDVSTTSASSAGAGWTTY